jgi:hypothetical protein
LEQRRLTLLDVEKLEGISGLNPDYLRLGTTPSGLMHYFDPAGILPQDSTAVEATSHRRIEPFRVVSEIPATVSLGGGCTLHHFGSSALGDTTGLVGAGAERNPKSPETAAAKHWYDYG